MEIEFTALITIISGLIGVIIILLMNVIQLHSENKLLMQTVRYFNVGDDLDFQNEADVEEEYDTPYDEEYDTSYDEKDEGEEEDEINAAEYREEL